MADTVNNNRGGDARQHGAHDTRDIFPRQPDLAALREMRILLVDDLPTNIILAQAILEHGGFNNIITAESGDRALQILESRTHAGKCDIDVVLLDIILPGKNGYSVCRSMRKHPALSYIPVILITSDTKWKEETALAAFENGATDILFKPVRSVELLPRVIAALSLKSERDNRLASEKKHKEKLDEHILLEARLKYLVSHDELTGLFNRRRLEQLLELTNVYAKNYGRESALLYIDIDAFGQVNDREGFEAGDRLLIEVASRLKNFAGDNNIVARMGTDSFALLLDDCSTESALYIARELVAAVKSMTFTTLNNQYHASVSVGIAMISRHEHINCSEIIARAHLACQQAGEAAPASVSLYTRQS